MRTNPIKLKITFAEVSEVLGSVAFVCHTGELCDESPRVVDITDRRGSTCGG